MRPLKYVLDGHEPVPSDDYAAVEAAIGTRVALDTVDGVMVSTIFLAIDMNMHGVGPAVLFETLVRGGPLDREQNRYATWDEAERGHAAILARVLAATGGTAS